MSNNAYNAAKFLVDLYSSTGAVQYLPDDCYHNKEVVIETLELAYINRAIFMPKGQPWPWNELKVAIMYRTDWGDAASAESYEQLHYLAAGSALETRISDVNMALVADAIVKGYRKATADSELARVLHDLRLAQFAVTGQGVNTKEVLDAFDEEFNTLFDEEVSEKHKEEFRKIILRNASLKDVSDLFCTVAFAHRYAEAFKLRMTRLAALIQA